MAQLETATVSGQVVDPSGLSITGAQVKLVDIDRETSNRRDHQQFWPVHISERSARALPNGSCGRGFKIVNVTGLTVNVQDHLEQNFRLQVGSVAESVTVEGGALQVNTTDATVSTVVDRQFAENLPLNGRSFQTLIELTPGVVVTPAALKMRTIQRQWAARGFQLLDGGRRERKHRVSSANLTPGNGLAGALGSFSALGGTNSLVSVDAMQEFRIQTSTFAPEFGRTPGGQISIVTRSGTNQFHGTHSIISEMTYLMPTTGSMA